MEGSHCRGSNIDTCWGSVEGGPSPRFSIQAEAAKFRRDINNKLVWHTK